MIRKVVVSGMRPTARLHLGNYWGALRNWIELQDKYQCYFFVADLHALTTGYRETRELAQNVRDMVLSWVAAGLDPEKCVIFRQSHVPEHAELALLLSMTTPLGWLLRNPTYKEQLEELYKQRYAGRGEGAKGEDAAGAVEKPTSTEKLLESEVEGRLTGDTARAMADINTHGFLGYPVLQAADIFLYKGELVPVGQDQVPHLELSRELARRFDSLYGGIFPEPQPLLTPTPKVPGLDGRKMSKSYANTVELVETPKSLQEKVLRMYTDPLKVRQHDKGHPEPCPENPPGCVVFAMHKLYNSNWPVRERECREGEIGCVACKKDAAAIMEKALSPVWERWAGLENNPQAVEEILRKGAEKAGAVARKTMAEVKKAMNL